ncbi:NAD(P)-dependent oxidoreductase [Pelagicoccus enzymogenes]|uniref:NAD(P)-dependent oxidoreductase n=1 Tax=Pelagicoccus enzymogenes TaxID=2773457 RepID=UPI00280E3FA1|nr:NAD(P)-dependent oxidoreductase [Pelagicoccus enzymogenes]MDQ8199407.1 NAD(P)-dependent oxidoreductase [Pelagicoccus enzymogenes]
MNLNYINSQSLGVAPAKSGSVGVVGLGLLGGAVVERLYDSGYEVYGYDISFTKSEKAILLSSAGDVFDRCDTVMFCLPESATVRRVLSEVDKKLRPSTHRIVDATTGHPEQMKQYHCALKNRGVVYVEANVAGSSDALRNGEATLLIGGDENEVSPLLPLFEALCKRAVLVGEAGRASHFKLVHNLLLGLNRAALAEALGFGAALGFERADVLQVLSQTPAFSKVMETKGQRMVDGDFSEPQARLSQHLKDVRLILDIAESGGIRTPLSREHCRILAELEKLGYGAYDNSVIAAAFGTVEDLGADLLR